MKHRFLACSGLLTLDLSLSACSGMSGREKNTAAGAVLTGGSAAGTVGGAAVGGVIGNQIDPKKK